VPAATLSFVFSWNLLLLDAWFITWARAQPVFAFAMGERKCVWPGLWNSRNSEVSKEWANSGE
jgi:hypothetical protein